MGLFDTIVIHDSLLPEEIKEILNSRKIHDWQTKSLDSFLDYYYITENKELLKITSNEDIRELRKHNRYPKESTKEYITDTIYAYTYTYGMEKDDYDISIELKLVLVNGVMESLTIEQYTKTPSKQRIENLENHCRESNRRKQLFTYVVIDNLIGYLDRLSNLLSKLRYRLSDYINKL